MRVFLAALLLTSTAAHAGDVFTVGKGGAPFCLHADRLHEMLKAMHADDNQWLTSSEDDCGFLKEGVKVAVLEAANGAVKIRAFGPTGSAVGYSVTAGYRPGSPAVKSDR